MKKKISIVLSVLMMASALGACGGKTTDAPAVSRNADAPGETAADSGKTPIKIAFSGPMTGDYAARTSTLPARLRWMKSTAAAVF